MSVANETTILMCLFHHDDQAQAALEDLKREAIPASAITVIGGSTEGATDETQLESIGVPARDLEHLQEGIRNGGTVISVNALPNQTEVVERIFDTHHAGLIDETGGDDRDALVGGAAAGAAAAALPLAHGQTAIPVVQEDLEVGKRTVDRGGVRVYRRVVEIPVEQSVNLREEHVVVERKSVDRPASAADLAAQDRSIELTETAEEAVIGKTAHVVEEVHVGKQVGEHTEHIRETVRRTEVEVEKLPSSPDSNVK